MSSWRPSICRVCRTAEPPISSRGLCEECAIERQTKSAVQLSAREGDYYERWKASMTELMPSRADRF